MKNRTKNYNYVVLFYDIGEKRVGKIFKICKKYLNPFQKSVFRGEITPSKIIELETELSKKIKKNEDFICLLKMYGDWVFDEKILGTNTKNLESAFL